MITAFGKLIRAGTSFVYDFISSHNLISRPLASCLWSAIGILSYVLYAV